MDISEIILQIRHSIVAIEGLGQKPKYIIHNNNLLEPFKEYMGLKVVRDNVKEDSVYIITEEDYEWIKATQFKS